MCYLVCTLTCYDFYWRNEILLFAFALGIGMEIIFALSKQLISAKFMQKYWNIKPDPCWGILAFGKGERPNF